MKAKNLRIGQKLKYKPNIIGDNSFKVKVVEIYGDQFTGKVINRNSYYDKGSIERDFQCSEFKRA